MTLKLQIKRAKGLSIESTVQYPYYLKITLSGVDLEK